MRNLLEEFNEDHGVRPPTILGVREHIFTGRLSIKIGFSFLFWFEPRLASDVKFFAAVFLLWRGSCQIRKRALLPLVNVYLQGH